MIDVPGLEVELAERACFPREKAYGEGLMPAGVAALERLGVRVSGAPFRGVRYHLGDETALGLFPAAGQMPAAGRGIRRRRLDAALFRTAAGCLGVRARSEDCWWKAQHSAPGWWWRPTARTRCCGTSWL